LWWRDGSVHVAPWPRRDEVIALCGEVTAEEHAKWQYARTLLGEVRKRRSEAKQPVRAPIVRAVFTDTPGHLAQLDAIETDLRSAGRISVLERVPGERLSVHVEFGALAE